MSAKSLSTWCRGELDELLGDVSMLVRHESPSGEKALLDRTADSIMAWLDRRLGAPDHWTRHDHAEHGDLLEVTYSGATGAPVLMIGHYDTVWPSGTLDGWPFAVRADGTATGPGIYDMKAGLVTGVWAVLALRAFDLPCPTVRFLFNGDEELGSPKSRPHIERAAQDCLAALVLEPGVGWDVKTERKGVGIFTVTTHGVEAHAGNNPTDGASAVHALAEIVHQLTREADHDRGTTINVGTISGGTARNVIAGQASCLIDIRVSEQAEAERIDRVFAALRASDPRVRVRVDGRWSRPPMRLGPASRTLFDLANDVATALRAPLDPISVGGGSDANFVSALGLPVLDGLGASGGGAHARHEHVVVDDIPDRVALVAGLLSRLADEPRGQRHPQDG
ncbi:M20 family metallopeptidase [Goodfellowiella coeruleoviolacea]|uniref:M20 family metallopeptidase n=1 Tax=Goodfellowiella coeruleoviolacea TaxID=334858 RepID=UPI0020A42A02|nr:M20 family metallopeptidase [Goodfellowiella coeruleoviolacea]